MGVARLKGGIEGGEVEAEEKQVKEEKEEGENSRKEKMFESQDVNKLSGTEWSK